MVLFVASAFAQDLVIMAIGASMLVTVSMTIHILEAIHNINNREVGAMSKNMKEVREQFESVAASSDLSVERNDEGEYMYFKTAYMWDGYWAAKVDSGELTGEDAKLCNASK